LSILGAEIEIENGYINARAPKGLIGGRYVFPKVSVGATHVLMMAATLAKGQTVIENAAREPEVADLAKCLIAMGAKIAAPAHRHLVIDGVTSLSGARHKVLPDRIETGTYAMAVAMTGGDVLLENTSMDLLESALLAVSRAGVDITRGRWHPCQPQWRRHSARRRDHRSVSGVSHRSAGAVHGA
jgi:UDP-N-acetylglucosamine 1-carboxyvinyltransferase